MNDKDVIKKNIKKLKLELAENIKYESYVPASNLELLEEWSKVNSNIFYNMIKLKNKLKKMKCKKCGKEAYKPKGGICPTWEMAYAINHNLCLECANKIVKVLRIKNNIIKNEQ